MRFEAPTSLSEALQLLQLDGARCLAGGQSLGVMMNADLVDPQVLVSLARLEELKKVEPLPDGGIRVGAGVTYERLGELSTRHAGLALLAGAVPLIAHQAIRTQGTIGGSLCHADPGGDMPTLATCLGATLRIASASGMREVAAGAFFHGYFETAVRPGEMLVSIDLPPCADSTSGHYEKFMLTHGDFAVASVAVLLRLEQGVCRQCSVAVGACAPAPVRVAEAERVLVGTRLDDEALRRAGEILVEACDPVDDFRGSREYRLQLVPRLLRRAIGRAAAPVASA